MAWLERDLIVGPYLVLCTTEAEFHKVLRHCKVPQHQWAQWIGENADATTHELTNTNGGHICVVCLRAAAKHSGIQVAAMLVHEAVHVWQNHCERIGERNPSCEFEAYAVQSVAQRLMDAYARTLTKNRRGRVRSPHQSGSAQLPGQAPLQR